MMRAGDLDRRVTIERRTLTTDPYSNETIEEWTAVATVWAKVAQTSGREFLSASQPVAERLAVFTIRFRDDLEQTDRLVFGGSTWDVVAFREIGRREGLEIQAKATE